MLELQQQGQGATPPSGRRRVEGVGVRSPGEIARFSYRAITGG